MVEKVEMGWFSKRLLLEINKMEHYASAPDVVRDVLHSRLEML